MDDDLYREPRTVLEREMEHLRRRLKEEQAEVRRYEELRDDTFAGIDAMLLTAEQDADRTKALIAEYKAAIKAVRG